jgi:very-short-patch-repair endonuclease
MGDDVRLWRGLRLSSPERTWCELGAVLGVSDLVAVGDYLIHWRRPFCSINDLARAVRRYPGRRGLRALTAALPLLDERSESPQESRLRVLLLAEGIEGLATNLVITVRGRNYRADLALPRWKVAIEYQSEYHRETEQWRRDMSKREEIATVGWHTMEVNADDLDRGARLADRVRATIAGRPVFS